ncbi:MAG: hypothetical protein NXI18_04670 [Alphaproteobacteria bacterium]|nr:hypothetical protein [Alphaproteobacteria bacterium]
MDGTTGRRSRAVALTFLIGLCGCATTTPAPVQTEKPEVAAAPVARGAAPVPMTVARSKPVALRDETSLRALDPSGIERLIGPPTFVRQDGGATIWQYSADGCVVDLFWYRSDGGQALLHVESRNVYSQRTADTTVCLNSLWQRRADQADS